MLLTFLCISCQSTRQVTEQATQHGNGKLEDLSVSEFEGRLYFFYVNSSDLDSGPKWLGSAPFPPLSPRHAESAARAEAQRIRPDVTKWLLDSIKLVPIRSLDNPEVWYYCVRLWRGDIAITGLPYFLEIPVLMDGRAVAASTKERPK